MSLVHDVAARLKGIGYNVTRVLEGSSHCRLDGIPGWSVLFDEVPGWTTSLESGVLAMMAAKRGEMGLGGCTAVVVKFKSAARVLMLHADLASAVQQVRAVGVDNRAACAAANRVLSRADVTKAVPCGQERLRGCLLSLESWLTLLLAWRVVGVQKRAVAPLPGGLGGTFVRPGVRAYDYNAVRQAQVEEETRENLQQHGKMLWSSVMGFATVAVESGEVGAVSGETLGLQEHGEGEGRGKGEGRGHGRAGTRGRGKGRR